MAGLGIKTLHEISEENVTNVDTISIDRNEMSEIHCLTDSDLIPRSFLSSWRTFVLIIGAGPAISRKKGKGMVSPNLRKREISRIGKINSQNLRAD